MNNNNYFFAMICVIGVCVGVIFYQQSSKKSTGGTSYTNSDSSITSVGSGELNIQNHLVAGKYTIFKFGAQW